MEGQAPRFSIVIPVFNRAGSVMPTLQSVLDQTEADFECLIVDDGSADGAELADLVARLDDARFRYIRQDNGGASAARNTGVRHARGDYVAFLDSDDLFLPDKLKRVGAVLDACPGHAIYSRSLVDRGVGRVWTRPDRAIGEDEDMGVYLFVHNQFIPTCTLVLPRSVALAVPFDTTLRVMEDPDLCFRVYRSGTRFRMIDEPLAIWNDATAANRLSHGTADDAALRWLDGTGQQLSVRARYGYRATVLAYYQARQRPFTTMADLLRGWVQGGVPGRIIARQAMRSFLPASTYRRLVNAFVSLFGRRRRTAG